MSSASKSSSSSSSSKPTTKSKHHRCRRRPNVLIIMADDMGFSDISSFGSEIKTPHLDSLSQNGIRFSQMYNCARCCPSRASLLTGLYPHQAGIGHMAYDAGVGKAYQGYLRDDNVVTVAEVMKAGGYQTFMAGKWHVGGEYPPGDPNYWVENAGKNEAHPIPVQRGFEEHYGTLGGGGSYFDPPSLVRDDVVLVDTPDDYYYTDAINDEACRMIRCATAVGEEDGEGGKPFFLYVAHYAPHWPLHAPSEEIAKYKGKYNCGWDELRKSRTQKLKELGIIKDCWDCSPRDEHAKPWDDAENKEWEDARMATYAAQIDIMDQGIGRIIQTLKDQNVFEDTMIIFLSDNGGCAEFLHEDGEEGTFPEVYSTVASDGTQTIVGNDPNRMPGEKDTFMSYDLPWANASNAPFRLFKSWVHEGGIATPFIVHWPAGINNPGRIHHSPWIMLDISATCYDVCGIAYPGKIGEKLITPLEGESFSRVMYNQGNKDNNDNEDDDDQIKRSQPLFWEHQGNRAVRDGKWKLVHKHGDDWELFDMELDRTELKDLSKQEPDIVRRMIAMWKKWAVRCEVKQWPLHPLPEGDEDYNHLPWLW